MLDLESLGGKDILNNPISPSPIFICFLTHYSCSLVVLIAQTLEFDSLV